MIRLVWLLLLSLPVSTWAGLESAPKVSELRGNESLWAFLMRLPSSFEAQIFYGVVLFGIVGLFANYATKWLRGEIAGSLIKYLFLDNVRGTLLSLSAAIGVGIGGITAGVFETASGEFVGWFNVMWIGLTNGFMWDAALNGSQSSAKVATP